MRLRLPYVFEVRGLLYRQAGERALLLRSEIATTIDEARKRDLRLALVTEVNGEIRSLYEHHGCLYVDAHHRRNGPVRIGDFEALIFGTPGTFRADWNASDFPAPTDPEVTGLLTNALDFRGRKDSLYFRRLITDGQHEREAQAMTFYPTAFLNVDGYIFMRVPVPVWQIANIGNDNWEIRIRLRALAVAAAEQFACREFEEAQRFVQERLRGRVTSKPDRVSLMGEYSPMYSTFERLACLIVKRFDPASRESLAKLEPDMRIAWARIVLDDRPEWLATRQPYLLDEILRQRWLLELSKPENGRRWQLAIDSDPHLDFISF